LTFHLLDKMSWRQREYSLNFKVCWIWWVFYLERINNFCSSSWDCRIH
jgi:hypothetical protein